jgi:hypothetical protein
MSWQGGDHQWGDRVHNGHDYYPRGINKTNVAFAKGNVLFADPATGNLRLATTGDKGPFYVAYNASLGSDVRQHCWATNGNWLLIENTTQLKPNALVVPITGKVRDVATGPDITTGILGIYLGTVAMGAELTSNNVIQDTAAIGSKCVIEITNEVLR